MRVVPSPTCPKKLYPQQNTPASAVRAHPWSPAAAIPPYVRAPLTAIGTIASAPAPAPSCPTPFAPQQYAHPLSASPQLLYAPVAIRVNVRPPRTAVGILRS